MGPEMGPLGGGQMSESIRNSKVFGSKLGPAGGLFWAHFGAHFGLIFGSILGSFWDPFRAHFGTNSGAQLGTCLKGFRVGDPDPKPEMLRI